MTDSTRFLFVHIPKTAGISLFNVLADAVGHNYALRFANGSDNEKQEYISMPDNVLRGFKLLSWHFSLPRQRHPQERAHPHGDRSSSAAGNVQAAARYFSGTPLRRCSSANDSAFYDYDVHRMLCYEDNKGRGYINVQLVPRVPHDRIRIRFGRQPEECRRRYLRPDQEAFFREHLAEVFARFSDE